MKVIKKKKLSEVKPTEEKSAPKKYTDLREVMDYSRDLSIFFSGVESKAYFRGCYEIGVRNFLMSYHSLHGRPLKDLMSDYDGARLFIDSGAFSYIDNPDFAERSIEEWDSHVRKYLKWAERNREYIFAIANLDIELIVGDEQVKKWNRELFEPFMLRTGIPVCFIWHDECHYATWEQYCQRYPYVGMTAVVGVAAGQDLAYFRDMLKVAEKYNTLVHGMGMTRTSVLPNLPFYSVDSISWKAGLMYGKTNIWNNDHISVIDKKDLETKAFPVISGYDLPIDLQKLKDEDAEEVVKANAYAYLLAERFLHEKQKSLIYWKRARAVKNSVDKLPADFFPPPEWFVTKHPAEELQEYAKKMNINPELPDLDVTIYEVTSLMNWDNPDYSRFKEMFLSDESAGLKDCHDRYVNKIVDTDEQRVEDLQKFFGECIEGTNETLLQMGTNFDRRQLERDEYVEDDDEYDLVDVPKEEVLREVKGLLPSRADAMPDENGAPEIDSLDKEIFSKAEIVPLFDENGKFIKGQRKVKKPKQVYSKKYPKLVCDNCFAAAKCPEYKAGGYVCAYNKMFKRFDTRNMNDIIDGVQGIVNMNMERMQKAMIFETLNGNLDGNVSSLMDTNMKYLLLLKDMYDHASAETLRQTRVVRADGTVESTTQISNPQSGGILEKIFGGMGTPMQEDDKKKVRNSDSEVIEAKVVESDAKDSSPAS